MKTDELMQRLASDAEPVRSFGDPVRRALRWATGAGIYLGVMILLMAPGGEWSARLGDVRFTVEQLAALLTGIVAGVAALVTVVPGYNRRAVGAAVAAAGIWVAAVTTGSVQDVLRAGTAAFQVQTDWPCVFTIVAAGAPLAAALGLMIRQGAPLTPRMTLGLVGLAAVSFTNVGACMLRTHETSLTVLLWHGATILAVCAAAAAAGTSVLRWRLPLRLGSADA